MRVASQVFAEGSTYIARRVYSLLLREDFDYAEFQAAVIAALWGFWLLFIGDRTLDPVLRGPILGGLWGWGIFTMGVFQLIAIISNNYELRRGAALVAVVMWLFFTVRIFLLEPQRLLFPTAGMLSLGSAWGYLRLGLRGR